MGYSRSRARCMPLQYPLSATRGVKQALSINKPTLNQNSILTSTPLQEKINTSEKSLNFTNKEATEQVSQSESGMFYELLNKKGMECETYQDCSWFQQSPTEPDCKNKLSPVETFDPLINAEDINLPVQCAPAHMSLWGTWTQVPCEYLEVFTDDILKENDRLRDKKNQPNISNENFYNNYEMENFDPCNMNSTLKKSDSMDSMKNISLTDPSEVIPITYKERLNNLNYGLTKLDRVKTEIKQEFSKPDSLLYLVDSDDNDINIGREEEVEEMITEDSQVVNKKETVNLDQVKFKDSSDYAVNQKNEELRGISFENGCNKVPLPIKTEHPSEKQTSAGKSDLNLDITKVNFEQSLNLSTPDLDFFDLVEYINEEMHQECNTATLNSSSNGAISQKDTNLTSSEHHSGTENAQPNNVTPSQSSSSAQNEPLLNGSELTTSDKFASNEVKNGSTVDLKAVSDSSVSIAERIKTGAKRKARTSLKDLIDSDDDEDFESSGEEYDCKDDDYDYREDLVKRRNVPLRRRKKLSSVDSQESRQEEDSSYREKRDKNNEASRRSRQNRKAREREMHETLQAEERKNVSLKAKADVLEMQVTSLRQLLLQVALRNGGAT